MNRYTTQITAHILSFVLMFVFPQLGVADTIEDVTHDFAPASGYIIQPVKDVVLTDINAEKGIKIGDLLSVVEPGEKVVHPVTGEILASLDNVLSVLRVTQVKSDYSYAVPLSGAEYATSGALVNRFSGLKALFLDQRGGGEDLYRALQTALPALDWQGYYPADADPSVDMMPVSDLLFSLTSLGLEVKDATGRVIHSYTIPPDQNSPTTTAALQFEAIGVASDSDPPDLSWAHSNPLISPNVKYDNEQSGYELIGNLPTNTLMADFTASDKQFLLATTDGNSIFIYQGDGQLSKLAEHRFASVENIHAVRWWRPSGSEILYLAVSSTIAESTGYGNTTETKWKSSVLAFRGKLLVPVATNLDYLLGAFDLNSDGRNETLLGQELDLDNFFGQVKQLQFHDGKIDSNKSPLKLSRQFPVQGSVLANLSGNNRLEAAFIRNGTLMIERNGKSVYQSRSELGGSLSQLTYDKNPGQADALFAKVTFEVSPQVFDLDGDGQPEVIAISSDHSNVLSLGGKPNIQKSRITVFKYNNDRYLKGTLGGTLDSPIQGFYASRNQILVVTGNSQPSESEKKTSQVWSFRLKGVTGK